MDEKERIRKNQSAEMMQTDSGNEESDIRRNRISDSRREAIRRERMEARRRQVRRTYMMLGAGVAAVILLAGTLIGISRKRGADRKNTGQTVSQNQDTGSQSGQISENSDTGSQSGQISDVQDIAAETESETAVQQADIVEMADRKAAMYDYDGAMDLLKAQPGYSSDSSLQQKVSGYQAQKDACVAIDPQTVEHVFVHSLIVDPARAFDGDAGQDGYNKNMVTLEEFQKIIQSMYNNGYVLVSLHDMGYIDENGQMQKKTIYLPEGKKPVIFSQDDVSYYHSYDNDGFPDKLLIDENGRVKNQYTDTSGNVTIGDYDMVPVIDTFVEEHPDFSYRGMKGIVVLTGYDGILGYRTDSDYRDRQSLQLDQEAWLAEHPDFNIEDEIAEATKVATAMRENGWEFANHTWGHISVSDVSLETLQKDTQRWLDNVAPIIGGTDLIIFAFGSDIGDWTGYASDNAKFNYLKSVGFDYYCNVDGSKLSWVQFGNTYLRTGRMNIDGYRMSTNPQILSPLFDVSQVYDTTRPPMPAW